MPCCILRMTGQYFRFSISKRAFTCCEKFNPLIFRKAKKLLRSSADRKTVGVSPVQGRPGTKNKVFTPIDGTRKWVAQYTLYAMDGPSCLLFVFGTIWASFHCAEALLTFEKTSGVAVTGLLPRSANSPTQLSTCIRNCFADDNCRAVTFAIPAMQCSLFNVSATTDQLIPSQNVHYLEKVNFPRVEGETETNCNRKLWTTEKFSGRAFLYDSTDTDLVKVIDGVPFRTRCSGLCLQETDFLCLASQYNSTSQQCALLTVDGRKMPRRFVVDNSTDYTENLCLSSEERCNGSSTFEKYNDVVFPPFYFDKSSSAQSAAACSKLCNQEVEFNCRSFLYQPASKECSLSHSDRSSLDREIIPTLPRVFASILGRPLTEYYEFTCFTSSRLCPRFTALTRYSVFQMDVNSTITAPAPVDTLAQCEEFCITDTRIRCEYLTYISSNFSCSIASSLQPTAGTRGYVGDGDYLQYTCPDAAVITEHGFSNVTSGQSRSFFAASSFRISTPIVQPNRAPTTPGPRLTLPAGFVPAFNAPAANRVNTPRPTGRRSFFGPGMGSAQPISANPQSTTTSSLLAPVRNSALQGLHDQDILQRGCNFTRSTGSISNDLVTASIANVTLDSCKLLCEAITTCRSFSYSSSQRLCLTSTINVGRTSTMVNASSNSDFLTFEKSSGCTNIRFECTDSQISVRFDTEQPFHGRVFIEDTTDAQCGTRVSGQRSFTWSIPLSAEPCNTVYDGEGQFSNTITVQYHDVLVTKNDRKYRINCKYDIGILNVSSSALAVANPPVTRITMNPLPPNLTVEIRDLGGRSVQSVLIGDTLVLTIAVPENSPYGISARNCYAFGGLEGERIALTDDRGCPVLPEYFRPFHLNGKSLQAEFDAFRFRNSYLITYQCTVNYCLDACAQPLCRVGNSSEGPRSKRDAPWNRAQPEENNSLGTYNIRKQLEIADPQSGVPERQAFEGGDVSSSRLCPSNAIIIALAVFAAFCLILNIVFFVVALRSYRKRQLKSHAMFIPY